jgi:NifB/MoaA-like Fe-S oxidoreductase
LRRPPHSGARLNATILTGKLFAPELETLVARLNTGFGTRLKTLAVENTYFGSDIVVAGLVTGRDVLAARDQIEGESVILPSVMFKSDEPVMLDGTTRDELERELGLPLRVLDFEGFAALLLGN